MPKPGRKEAGTGERLNHFNNQINKHKIKVAAPHGWLPHTKHKLKSRPGPLSSFTVVTPHLTLPKLLHGTRDWWVTQVSFIIIYSTGLAPFPRLSAPSTRHTHQYKPYQPGVCDHMSDVWHLHYCLWQYTIHDAVITANVTTLVVTCFIHSIWRLALCCWCEAACSCSALETHYIKLLLQSVLLILMPVLVCNSSAIESAVLMTLRIICLRTQWLCSVTLRGLLLGCCCS